MSIFIKEISSYEAKTILKVYSMDKDRHSFNLKKIASLCPCFNDVINEFYARWDECEKNIAADMTMIMSLLSSCSVAHTEMWRTILSGIKNMETSIHDEVQACFERSLDE